MGTFLFVTDLHGSRWKYERTLGLAEELRADLVVNGDLETMTFDRRILAAQGTEGE